MTDEHDPEPREPRPPAALWGIFPALPPLTRWEPLLFTRRVRARDIEPFQMHWRKGPKP